jgi:drug/metabolite transporter (DMT)-like permease
MNRNKAYPMVQAILAAMLFGASAPLSKILLGSIEPIPLTSFLYLGSGTGLLLFQAISSLIRKKSQIEAPLTVSDIPWLTGAVMFGGVIAPIILMFSLRVTPASTSSLLLNFEGVATTVIAVLFFKESAGKRVWTAVLLITCACVLLSWDFSNKWGLSIGALGIISACLCWGIDNNLTRNISSKNPFLIVTIKGFGAGLFSLILSFMLGNTLPDIKVILMAMLLGCFSYGLSIVLFVLAMRNMGSARTSALFGTAPFIGTILSFLLYNDKPGILFAAALPVMILGAALLLKENHSHRHLHEYTVHEHKHTHTDGHHNHVHQNEALAEGTYHSHIHTHEEMEHEHPHLPDIHHRHKHD